MYIIYYEILVYNYTKFQWNISYYSVLIIIIVILMLTKNNEQKLEYKLIFTSSNIFFIKSKIVSLLINY